MASIWSATLLISLVVSSSHHKALEERIVNGDPVSASQYPWMVSLRYEFEYEEYDGTQTLYTGSHFCGAALIESDPITIITAAHCVDFFKEDYDNGGIISPNTPYGNITVTIACDLNRTVAQQTATTMPNASSPDYIKPTWDTLYVSDYSMINIHPKYSSGFTSTSWGIYDGYDIALLIIPDDDMYNDQNQTAPEIDLPTIPGPYTSSQSCCTSGEELTQTGYGNNATNGSLTETLEKTTMDYVTGTQCFDDFKAAGNDTIVGVLLTQYLFVDEEEIPNRFVCAKTPGTDACQGDSGGPLFRIDVANYNKPEIVGVVSYGEGCAHPSAYPGFWTSTGHFYTWIQDTINPTPSPTKEPTRMGTDGTNRLCLKYLIMVVSCLLVYIL